MAYGIIEGNGNLDFNLIAKYYGLWICSHPFDLGNTIKGALSGMN